MEKRVRRGRVRVLAGVAGFVCLLAAFSALFSAWTQRQAEAEVVHLPVAERDRLIYNGAVYQQNRELDTFLIMGLDKFEDEQESGVYLNRQQADFILLLAVDRKAKTYSALHLNRDTMTEMHVLGERGERIGSVNRQLALAHTYGSGGTDSCRNTVDAVSTLLQGVKIDHYMSMTMDGVGVFNDQVGGVPVEVLDDFSEVDPTLVKGETLTLMGDQALTYVRARKGVGDQTNLQRMERQQQYLAGLFEVLGEKSQTNPELFVKTMMSISDYIVSDVTVNQLSALVERIRDYSFAGFYTLDGEAVLGEKYMEYHVDEDQLKKTVLELYFKR